MNISKYIKDYQIVSVVGATATGKTAFALDLTASLIVQKRFQKIHLLSADSRQVYRGLENLTGADLPSDFSTQGDKKFAYPFFHNSAKNIFLHGVSIINPKEEWSVAHFKKLFENVKENLSKEDFLIVVGGTGFYQQQITQSTETIVIPQNKKLRERLEKLNVEELKKELKELDQEKLKKMNNSDVNNPRRLIRAIEISSSDMRLTSVQEQNELPIFYLQMPKELREQKVRQRVKKRFEQAKKEVQEQLVINKNAKNNLPAFSSTGFMELQKFITGEIDEQKCLDLWQTAEIQYAKRQDTWWKKKPNLIKIAAEKI